VGFLQRSAEVTFEAGPFFEEPETVIRWHLTNCPRGPTAEFDCTPANAVDHHLKDDPKRRTSLGCPALARIIQRRLADVAQAADLA